MSKWDPRHYLQFERERTLPVRDLVSRIELQSPSTIVDLGCGPGNSTAVLAKRWPDASIIGVDSSAEMLTQARESSVRAKWILADIREWQPDNSVDLVFSNAALQWVSLHEIEIPRLFNLVAKHGALAFQIPTHTDLWFEVLEKIVMSPVWRDKFLKGTSEFYSYELGFYYDLLSGQSKRLDLWETRYFHVLSSPEAIVEWTQGTALRPLFDRLSDSSLRETFVKQYTEEIASSYPRQPDGNVLFPFLRRFVIAYR